MSGLGAEIAVLDGLDALDPNDGRIGQMRARVTQYARPRIPGVLTRKNVLDASEGANYSGGSAYAPGLPLMPSSIGLAGVPPQVYAGAAAPFVAPYLGRRGFGAIPGVLPTKRGVIDPSGGANYTGGSTYVPGLPLTVSSAGLADTLIKGGYGRAGLGASFIDGGYGRAGLGQTGTAADEDLAAASEAVATARAIDPEDGRIGQQRSQVDEYGRPVLPGVLARSNVLDASEGANYSGGSSYAPGLPLMPSSVGLAGLELGAYDNLDAVPDKVLGIPKAAKKIAGKNVVNAMKKRGNALAKRMAKMNPRQQAQAVAKLRAMGAKLAQARNIRRQIAQNRYAQRLPLWAR